MKRFAQLLFMLALCTMGSLHSQTSMRDNFSTAWSVNAFNKDVFVENKGQFDAYAETEKILYVADAGRMQICFTSHGVMYRYNEYPVRKKEEKEWESEKEGVIKPQVRFFSAEWKGTNSDLIIDASEEVSYYYTYGETPEKAIQAKAFKKVTYRNLYPGIDVEYTFINDKPGLKYSLIVHPGADISGIKLHYSGAKRISLNETGDLNIETSMGEFTEYAPVTFYTNGNKLNSSYKLQGKDISFNVDNIDPQQTVIIDPWVTNPNISGGWNANAAYDVDFDDY
ncbi:MAG TPA: hypothetical protein VNX68_12055, partial [Nitrosopumilaceae archaeon]|nr:hypothetical protein [Nitrosopumilaceae archaeon]